MVYSKALDKDKVKALKSLYYKQQALGTLVAGAEDSTPIANVIIEQYGAAYGEWQDMMKDIEISELCEIAGSHTYDYTIDFRKNVMVIEFMCDCDIDSIMKELGFATV